MIFTALGFFLAAGHLSAAPGDVDRRFGAGGYAFSHALADGTDGTDMAVQADGRILVVGTSYSNVGEGQLNVGLARFMPDGWLDGRFGRGEKVLTVITRYDHGNSLALLEDGSFLVGGTSGDSTHPGGAVVVSYGGESARWPKFPRHRPGHPHDHR